MRRTGSGDGDPRVVVRLDDEPDDPAPEPRRRPLHRRRTLLVGAGLVAVALGAATFLSNAAERREDAARRVALADVPGVLDPLEEPLSELWRAEEGSYAIAYTADAVALGTPEAVVEVRDAVTGEVRWRRAGVADESCVPLVATSAAVLVAGRPAERATEIVCWVSTDIVQAEGPLVVAPTAVVVLDVATGAETGQLEVGETIVGVEPLDDSVLVASADETGAVHVQRWSPRDGGTWAFEAPSALLGQIQDQGLVFRRLGGVFWLGGLDAPARSVETGEPVADPGPAPGLLGFGSGAVPLPDGGWASWTALERPGELRGALLTRVTDADGALRFEVPGRPWVDEGIAGAGAIAIVGDEEPADVLLMRLDAGLGNAGRVAGLDARTGEVLWEGDRLAGVAPCVRIGGVLVAAGADRVYGFDVATGRELWRGDATDAPGGGSVTDGERVVLPSTVADGPALTSFDMATGSTGWSMVLAERPVALWALGGRSVLMMTESFAVVMLG